MVIYKRALSASLLAPLVIAGVVGCSTQPREELTPQKSDSAPESAVMTEQEALDAAQQAYGDYLNVSNQILQEGAKHPEELKIFLSEDQYEQEKKTLSEIRQNEQHLEGIVRFDGLHLQEIRQSSISVYLCLDAAGARIVDKMGDSPTLTAQRWPLLVTFSKNSDDRFLISGSETWTGTNFC
jgi:hypothetical protein